MVDKAPSPPAGRDGQKKARARVRPITAKQRETFLAYLKKGHPISRAADEAGVRRQRFYELREADPDFAAAWEDAWGVGTEAIEDEMHRRGVLGVEKPVYQGGELVGSVREYSDRLLELMLKARLPRIYRERLSVDHAGRVETRVSGNDLSKLTPEQLRQLKEIQRALLAEAKEVVKP